MISSVACSVPILVPLQVLLKEIHMFTRTWNMPFIAHDIIKKLVFLLLYHVHFEIESTFIHSMIKQENYMLNVNSQCDMGLLQIQCN